MNVDLWNIQKEESWSSGQIVYCIQLGQRRSDASMH